MLVCKYNNQYHILPYVQYIKYLYIIFLFAIINHYFYYVIGYYKNRTVEHSILYYLLYRTRHKRRKITGYMISTVIFILFYTYFLASNFFVHRVLLMYKLFTQT